MLLQTCTICTIIGHDQMTDKERAAISALNHNQVSTVMEYCYKYDIYCTIKVSFDFLIIPIYT